MVLEFDVKEFCQNLKATKPPYECPFEDCNKIYKSYLGIRFHLFHFDHETGKTIDDNISNSNGSTRWHHRQNQSRSPSPPTFFVRTPKREALTYAEAQKMVEVDIDGRVHRININEPLNIVFVNNNKNKVCSQINGTEVANDVNKGKEENGKHKSTPRNKVAKNTKTRIGKPHSIPMLNAVENESVATEMKLPEPSFRIIDDYNLSLAPPRPTSYFRYIEKSPDEIDEEVEYDMDEEDCAWLEIINSKRRNDRLPEVPADTFELLMDRLEKESYFQSQNNGKDVGPSIDEDAVCCICSDGECQNSNAILFCDMCNLAVHQECYGVPYIPEGQWLCRRCLQSPSRAVDCVLCPNKGGAFKQTDDSRWAHVVCALWIPEVCFANTVFLEPIDSIHNIPSARWKLTCYICKQRNVGACIQCHKANCYVAFHVTCAQQAGLYMKMEAIKELTATGLQTSVKKAAFCDNHTPPDENGTSLSGVYTSGDDEEEEDEPSAHKKAANKSCFKEKMRKARKILAEKRSALPVVSIPTIPPERLTKVAAMINIPKRNQFIQRLLGYWTLKRQSRNGVPLLRRLQISYTGSRRGDAGIDDDEQALQMREELKYMQRLRQDLEKARLLVELIRKREKLKREWIKMHQVTIELQLQPLSFFLKSLISLLEEKDPHKIFSEPVNVDEVPDYLDFISNPMDFKTMRNKINNNQYSSFAQFEEDFQLIIQNCMFYNEKDTIYYKASVKLRDQGRSILRDANDAFGRIGFDETTGLHSPPTASGIIDTCISQTQIQKELEDKLKGRQSELTKLLAAKSPGRPKKIESLTEEIAEIKKRLCSMNQFGNTKNPTKTKPNSKIGVNSTNHSAVISNSDSEATDIMESPLKTEKRVLVTQSATLEDFSTIGIKSKTESPSNKKNKFSGSQRSSKTANKNKPVIENGALTGEANSLNVNTNSSCYQTKINSSQSPSPLSSLSSPPSTPVKLNQGDTVSYRNAPLKSPMQKTITSDASTCTPPNMFTLTAESYAKEKANRDKCMKRKASRSHGGSRSKKSVSVNNCTQNLNSSLFSSTPLPQSDSFKVYRSNINSSSDSDVNSESSRTSSSNSTGSSGSSRSRSSSGSSCKSKSSVMSENGTRHNSHRSPKRPTSRSSRSDVSVDNQHLIPLQPLDLVWAKCRGYPWYPALIVNPDIPKTGYFHNGVPIPVPPEDVLALRENHSDPVNLVLFFDAKRTWQWLPRNKLEPLGVDKSLDQVKLTQSKKPADRKGVKKAFEKAILHRCRVTGESTDLSEDSSGEE